MKIFGNKDSSETVDERTELEKKFEEAGRKVGKTTGKVAQKGVNQYHDFVSTLEESGTMDKVRDAKTKVSDFTDDAIQKVDGAIKKADNAIKDAFDAVAKKNQEKDE